MNHCRPHPRYNHLVLVEDVPLYRNKLEGLAHRGLTTPEAVRHLSLVARARNATVVRQFEHRSPRIEVRVAGAVVIIADDTYGAGPVILTAWSNGDRWAPIEFARAARRIDELDLVDLDDRMRGAA